MGSRWEVLNIRPLESIYYAITVRIHNEPGFFGRLLGHKPSFQDKVFTGCNVWRDAATGRRVGLLTEDWLGEEVLKAEEARERYQRNSGAQ